MWSRGLQPGSGLETEVLDGLVEVTTREGQYYADRDVLNDRCNHVGNFRYFRRTTGACEFKCTIARFGKDAVE
jgi:hypothetical protein